MAYYTANPILELEGLDRATVYTYENPTQSRLYANRFDLLPNVETVKSGNLVVCKNGIEITRQDLREPTKYSQYPIGHRIGFIDPHDRIDVILERLNTNFNNLRLTLSVEFDHENIPLPSPLIPFSAAELGSVAEHIRLLDRVPFAQTLSETHYYPFTVANYTKMILTVAGNPFYDPEQTSANHEPHPLLNSLLAGAYAANDTPITKARPNPGAYRYTFTHDSEARPPNAGDYIYTPASMTEIQSSKARPTDLGPLYRALNVSGDLGRFVRSGQNFSSIIVYYTRDHPEPFDLNYDFARVGTGEFYTGVPNEQLEIAHCQIYGERTFVLAKVINAASPYLILVSYATGTLSSAPEIRAVFNSNVIPSSETPVFFDIVPDSEGNPGRRLNILTRAAGGTLEGLIKNYSFESTSAHLFDVDHRQQTVVPVNITTTGVRAGWTNQGRTLIYTNDTGNGYRVLSMSTVETPYEIPATGVPDPKYSQIPADRIYFRKSSDLYTEFGDTWFRFRFDRHPVEPPYTGLGYVWRQANGDIFDPEELSDEVITDTILYDMNNPENEDRTYRLRIRGGEDATELHISSLFLRDISYSTATSRINGSSWTYRSRISGPIYYSTATLLRTDTFNFVYDKHEIISNNTQQVDIYHYNEGDASDIELLESVPSFDGSADLEITTARRFVRIVKSVDYVIMQRSSTETRTSQLTRSFRWYNRRNPGPQSQYYPAPITDDNPSIQFLEAIPARLTSQALPNRIMPWPPALQLPAPLTGIRDWQTSDSYENRDDSVYSQTNPLGLTRFNRLPITPGNVELGLEVRGAADEWFTMKEDLGEVPADGRTIITINEFTDQDGIVLPKGDVANLRLALKVATQTELSIDITLTN